MGQSIFQYGDFSQSKNTLGEFDNEINYELLICKLKKIAAAIEAKASDQCVCYVMGMGAHPKGTYLNLIRDGQNVVWYASLLPRNIRWLSFILASYEGLLKVSDIQKIPELFLTLVERSMAGVYVFPKSFEGEFLDRVKNKLSPIDYSFGVKSNSNYFFYIVDADNTESTTGMYEIVSYGIAADDKVVSALCEE